MAAVINQNPEKSLSEKFYKSLHSDLLNLVNVILKRFKAYLTCFYFQRGTCEVAHFLSITAVQDIMLMWRFRLPLKCNTFPLQQAIFG